MALGIGEPRVGVSTIWEVGYQGWCPEKVTSRVGYKGWMGVSQIEMVKGYPSETIIKSHQEKKNEVKIAEVCSAKGLLEHKV